MKLLFSFLLYFFTLISLNGQVKSSNKDFKITEARVQSWSSGANQLNTKQSGGLIYEISVNILKTRHLKFDSLYLEGELLPVEIIKGTERNYTGGFTKGDKVVILARKSNGVVSEQSSVKLVEGISKSRKKGKGFISYWIKNKRYVASVTDFKVSSSPTRNQ